MRSTIISDRIAQAIISTAPTAQRRTLRAILRNMSDIYDELNYDFAEIMTGAFTDSEYWSKRSGFERLLTQYNSAVETSGGRDVQKYMYYTTGWAELFGGNGFTADYKLGLVAILGICISVSPLIAYDNRARIGYLLYTTKSGKGMYFIHNVIVSAIFAVMISLAVYIPHYVNMASTYGLKGILEPFAAISGLSGFGNTSDLGYLILLTAYRVVSLTVFAQLTLFISYKSKSPTTATLITLASFVLPIVIHLAGARFMQWLCLPVSGNKELLRQSPV